MGAHLGLGGQPSESVLAAHDLLETAVASGHDIAVSVGAHEGVLRRPEADAGQCRERGDHFLCREQADCGQVNAALADRAGELDRVAGLLAAELDREQVALVLQRGEALRCGKGGQREAIRLDHAAEPLDQRPLELGGEGDVDLLAEDRPDQRLEGVGDEDGSQAAIALHQPAEDRVVYRYLEEAGYVAIGGEDAPRQVAGGGQVGGRGLVSQKLDAQAGDLGGAGGGDAEDVCPTLEPDRPQVAPLVHPLDHGRGGDAEVVQGQIEGEGRGGGDQHLAAGDVTPPRRAVATVRARRGPPGAAALSGLPRRATPGRRSLQRGGCRRGALRRRG